MNGIKYRQIQADNIQSRMQKEIKHISIEKRNICATEAFQHGILSLLLKL